MSLMNYKYLSNWLLVKIIVSFSAKKELGYVNRTVSTLYLVIHLVRYYFKYI